MLLQNQPGVSSYFLAQKWGQLFLRKEGRQRRREGFKEVRKEMKTINGNTWNKIVPFTVKDFAHLVKHKFVMNEL